LGINPGITYDQYRDVVTPEQNNARLQKFGSIVDSAANMLISASPIGPAFNVAKTVGNVISGKQTVGEAITQMGSAVIAGKIGISSSVLTKALNGDLGGAAQSYITGKLSTVISKATGLPTSLVSAVIKDADINKGTGDTNSTTNIFSKTIDGILGTGKKPISEDKLNTLKNISENTSNTSIDQTLSDAGLEAIKNWKPTDTSMEGGVQAAWLSPDNMEKLTQLPSVSDSNWDILFNSIIDDEAARGDKGAFTDVGNGAYIQDTNKGVIQWAKDADGSWYSTILTPEQAESYKDILTTTPEQKQKSLNNLLSFGTPPDSIEALSLLGTGASSVGQDTGFAPITGGTINGIEKPKIGIGPEFSLIAFDTVYDKDSALSWIEATINSPDISAIDKKVALELEKFIEKAPRATLTVKNIKSVGCLW
jgi:hypothetical protein